MNQQIKNFWFFLKIALVCDFISLLPTYIFLWKLHCEGSDLLPNENWRLTTFFTLPQSFEIPLQGLFLAIYAIVLGHFVKKPKPSLVVVASIHLFQIYLIRSNMYYGDAGNAILRTVLFLSIFLTFTVPK